MGGFNIGELTGALRLDDSQFREVLERASKSADVFNVNVDKIGGSVQKLAAELTKAGFSLQNVQTWLNSLRKQGLETSQAVDTLADSIKRVQDRAAQLHALDVQRVQPGIAKDAMSPSLLAERERVLGLINRAKVETRFDDDARARQKEVESEMLGHVAYLERIQTEAQQKVIAAERAAYVERQRLFQEHRRQMQLAQAATVIGTTAVAVGGAGVGVGFLAAKDAINFQDAMVKSLAVVGQVSEQTRNIMAQTARDAAKETGIAVTEIAADYAIMAKGGLTAAQSIDLLPKAAKFAVATQSDLHESTRQIVTVMEALQIPVKEVDKVMNELVLANQLARGSVDQLATSLEGRSGAALRSAHVSLEQALALTVAFSRAGVTASQSQTFLTQVIERLGSASRIYGEELINVGKEQVKFKDIVYLADGSTRPFIDTLKLLDQAFQGKSAKRIGEFFDDIHLGSARGSQGLKILLSQSDLLDQLSSKFASVGDKLGETFATQLESPKRQLDILKAKVTDLAITIGIPLVAALQSFASAMAPVFVIVQDLAAKFAGLPKPMQETILLFGAVGSVALVAGGSLLVLAGHVLRLRADLILLQETGALSGLPALLSRSALAALGVVGAIAAVVLLLRSYKNELSDLEKKAVPNASSTNTGPFIKFPWQSTSQSGDKPAAAKIDPFKGQLDDFRKSLEDFRKQAQGLMDNSPLAVDPKKLEKQFLNAENFHTASAKFQDEYQKSVQGLSAAQDTAITDGIYKLRKLAQSGADKGRLDAALAQLKEQLEGFKFLNAERIKQSNEARAITDENIDAELKHELSSIAQRKDALVKTRAVTEDDVASRTSAEVRLAALSRDASLSAVQQKLNLLHDENNQEIVERLKLNAQKVQIEDSFNKEVQQIREKGDQESDQIRQQRIERAQQRELSGEIQQQSRLAAVRRAQASTQLGFGDISGQQFIDTQRKIDSEEIVIQSNAIRRQLQLLDATRSYNTNYRAQRESLMNELNKLNTDFYGREQEYQAQERRGFTDVTQAISEQVAEQKRLLQQPNRGGDLFDLSKQKIQTAALKTQQEGFLGIAATINDKVVGSFDNLGTSIISSLVKMQSLGKTMKDLFQGAIINIFGSALQKVFQLVAAQALTSLGIIKGAAVAAGVGQVNDAAAVGGAEAAASTAAIPIVGPGLAIAAGTAMYGSILATFLPLLSLGAFDKGGMVQSTGLYQMHADEYVMNRDLTKMLSGMASGGNVPGTYLDLRGARLDGGITPNTVRRMGDSLVKTLRGKGGKI